MKVFRDKANVVLVKSGKYFQNNCIMQFVYRAPFSKKYVLNPKKKETQNLSNDNFFPWLKTDTKEKIKHSIDMPLKSIYVIELR